eukprot:scaffold142686_cov31-Tisochrysis_lutea.AAC.4
MYALPENAEANAVSTGKLARCHASGCGTISKCTVHEAPVADDDGGSAGAARKTADASLDGSGTPPEKSIVAVSGTVTTRKPNSSRRALIRASAVVLPPHGPPVSTTRYSGSLRPSAAAPRSLSRES